MPKPYFTILQRWSRGRNLRGHGHTKISEAKTKDRLLEAKNTRRKRSPPPKKSPKIFFRRPPEKKNSFQIFREVFADFQSKVKKGHVHGSFLTKQKSAVLEQRIGHFRGLVGFKAKDFKMCP